jgi:hypothetical protein
MATERYPQRNVNMPMDPGAVEAARQRGVPNVSAVTAFTGPADGNGSRRQSANGEWIDDRRIVMDGPASPSADSPPEVEERERGVKGTPPASYDPTKVYKVKLGKPSTHAGRVLSADADYQMTGATCTEVAAATSGAIIDAVELGPVPADPNVAPSLAVSEGNGNGNTKKRKG